MDAPDRPPPDPTADGPPGQGPDPARRTVRKLARVTTRGTPHAPAPATPAGASSERAAELLGVDVHFAYHARALAWVRPSEAVRTAPPLEEGLANPVRVTHVGAEQRHHGVIAMLGAKWFRDVAPPAQVLFDPRDAQQRAAHNNQATALRFTLATGEHVVKLVLPHALADSRPGAHLIYTLITGSEERASAVAREPELLLALLRRLLAGQPFDLSNLALVRPIHDAHPSDLVSDPKLQRAIRAAPAHLARRLETTYRAIAGLQVAMHAQLALLEGTRATQRKQATSAFNERRSLALRSSEVEAEREALALERAATDEALANLDSRDAALREAAQRQLGQEIARSREERDEAREELAARLEELAAHRGQASAMAEALAGLEREREEVQAALAERDAALAEAEDIVQDLYQQIERLSKQGGQP